MSDVDGASRDWLNMSEISAQLSVHEVKLQELWLTSVGVTNKRTLTHLVFVQMTDSSSHLLVIWGTMEKVHPHCYSHAYLL